MSLRKPQTPRFASRAGSYKKTHTLSVKRLANLLSGKLALQAMSLSNRTTRDSNQLLLSRFGSQSTWL
jgi:hypothetical protein